MFDVSFDVLKTFYLLGEYIYELSITRIMNYLAF
jgi:hypothetical protein